MIQKLINPISPNYLTAKEFILGKQFSWGYNSSTVTWETDDDFGFYAHSFLDRPDPVVGRFYSKPASKSLDPMVAVFTEIAKVNNINIKTIYRMAANAVEPQLDVKASPEHVDHDFPHKNMLVYLTDSGGDTVCEGKHHNPKEDDVILFEGKHYLYTPETKRRVIILMTYV